LHYGIAYLSGGVAVSESGFLVSGVPLEPATEDALNSIAAEMKIGWSDLIGVVLREWLETNAMCRFR
jgi:hypothetical protein